jgi:hypothetical protein
MKKGLVVLAALIALSAGLLVIPAGAAGTSAVTNVVNDAGTSSPWADSETFGANAEDTAVVSPDVSSPAGGTLTYDLFNGASCGGAQVATQTVTLNVDGTVPNSNPTSNLDAGTYSYDAIYNGDGTNDPNPGVCESFIIRQLTPQGLTITNIPSNPPWSSGGGFTAQLGNTDGSDGTQFVASSTTNVCTASGLIVTYVTPGTCTLTAQTTQTTNFAAASGSQQTFTIGLATPTPTPSISNLPAGPIWSQGGGFTASLNNTNSDGAQSVTSSTTGVCTVSGLVVSYVTVGQCRLTAQTGQTTNFAAASGSQQTFTIGQATPVSPTVTNIPSSPAYQGSFTATVGTNSDGTASVTSSTTSVCTINGFTVSFVNVGTCTLTPHVTSGTDYVASTGSAQSFAVGLATPATPTIINIPAGATEFAGFTATVSTNGDGATSVGSISTAVCTVGSNGHTVSFVGFGVCTLTAIVSQGTHFLAATGNTQSFPVGPAARGYWLVGSDGGIFSFGAASFFGSMGSTPLQRPVVGITPSASRTGYWLVASDGGIFSFGSSSYYGSIPGVGLHPAGSGAPNSLNAPIVGMVPSVSGHGYFMVASDGGVFAFGDARFAGSCPGIGGCAGKAIAVMPDSTGKGYWLVTNTGNVYAFGDATFYGAPAPSTAQVVDAVATQDWRGYWLLYNNGAVASFGDATAMGAPLGFVNGFNPATSIFPTADGKGYWIASGRGDVFAYGDAPYLGSEAAGGLNGEIIAAFGF